jgi:zinc transporter ZupT
MIWMSFSELLPDAIKDTPKYLMATIMTIAIALMIMIEQLLGG